MEQKHNHYAHEVSPNSRIYCALVPSRKRLLKLPIPFYPDHGGVTEGSCPQLLLNGYSNDRLLLGLKFIWNHFAKWTIWKYIFLTLEIKKIASIEKHFFFKMNAISTSYLMCFSALQERQAELWTSIEWHAENIMTNIRTERDKHLQAIDSTICRNCYCCSTCVYYTDCKRLLQWFIL